MSKNDGGPAFPSHGSMGEVAQEGMTLRDYFAAFAMAQIYIKPLLNLGGERIEIDWGNLDIGADRVKEIVDYSAALSYLMADAMLKERAK